MKLKIKEDVFADYKPKDLTFAQVKKLFNKVKSNDYKFVNNEREEFNKALDYCDKKQKYTPEQRKQIKDWHTEIWRHNRNTNESLLKEGPGAGYTIEGKGTVDKISNIKILNVRNYKGDFYEGVAIDCSFDMVAIFDTLYFSSYYYGSHIDNFTTNIHVESATLELNDGDYSSFETVKSDALDIVSYELKSDTFELDYSFGGGWAHSTYDGTIADDDSIYHHIEFSGYFSGSYYITDAIFTDEKLINFIDLAVSGDNVYDEYVAYDFDDIEVDYFDEEDDAIRYAKSNSEIHYVDKNTWTYDFYYYIGEDGDTEFYDSETVWEREESDEDY